jgi:hypothetical protein
MRCIGWGLPFPLNIILLPFRFCEWLLTMLVAYDVKDGEHYDVSA